MNLLLHCADPAVSTQDFRGGRDANGCYFAAKTAKTANGALWREGHLKLAAWPKFFYAALSTIAGPERV